MSDNEFHENCEGYFGAVTPPPTAPFEGDIVVAEPYCERNQTFSTYHFIREGRCLWCGRLLTALTVRARCVKGNLMAPPLPAGPVFEPGGRCPCGADVRYASGIGPYCTRTGYDGPCDVTVGPVAPQEAPCSDSSAGCSATNPSGTTTALDSVGAAARTGAAQHGQTGTASDGPVAPPPELHRGAIIAATKQIRAAQYLNEAVEIAVLLARKAQLHEAQRRDAAALGEAPRGAARPPQPAKVFATDEEVRVAANRMLEKHRPSLERLAKHDGPPASPPALEAKLCECGHERDWHVHDGVGRCGAIGCRYDDCKQFRPALAVPPEAPPP